MKEYTIKVEKKRESTVTGTLEELIRHFGYTLEVGASYNSKINRSPKTIKSFVRNLQKAFSEKEAACYDRTYVSLV